MGVGFARDLCAKAAARGWLQVSRRVAVRGRLAGYERAGHWWVRLCDEAKIFVVGIRDARRTMLA